MKRMKKFLSVVLTVIFVIGMLPMAQIAELDLSGLFVNVFAAEVVNSGTCGDNLTWELDDEGTLTISGTGDMTNYSSYGPWTGTGGVYNTARVKAVFIGSGVTSIGNYAFAECAKLSYVEFPDGLTTIGVNAFRNCSSLTEINLPHSLNSINSYAFWDCSKLKLNRLPSNLTSIGIGAFMYCSSLSEITIPDGVTSIAQSVFSSCNSLVEITLPNTLISINNSSFSGCASLADVYFMGTKALFDAIGGSTIFDENVTIHYSEANTEALYTGTCGDELTWELNGNLDLIIRGSGNMDNYQTYSSSRAPWYNFKNLIRKVIVDNGATNIGSCAFYECTGLTDINLPNTIESIGGSAFYGCKGLTSIELPNSLTNIDNFAFRNCTGLIELTIPASVASIGSNSVFTGCSNLTTVNFVEGVTTIPPYVLSGATAVTTVNLPSTVTCIDSYAFRSCTGLTSIELPDSITSIGNSVFSGCTGLTSIELPDNLTSIGNSVFSGCTGLTSIELPDSITSIGSSMFSGCTGLTSIELPDNLTSIGNSAFSGCTGLASIELPDNLTSIGSSAFFGCTGLTEVTIPASVTTIGGSVNNTTSKYSCFNGCTNLEKVSFAEGITKIPDCALYNATTVKTITIPSTVTSIGHYAFNGCTSLNNIQLPDSVTNMGYSIFGGCSRLLTINYPVSFKSCLNHYYDYNYHSYVGPFAGSSIVSVTIPEGVETIPGNAFYGCASLSDIVISDSVTTIGSNAFANCTGIEEVVIPKNVVSMSSCFTGCTNLKTVIFADGIISIPASALNGCSGLTEVVIPDSVTSIGSSAFSVCTNLTQVSIPNNVTSIGGSAFYKCLGLTEITVPDSVKSIGSGAFNYCSGLVEATLPTTSNGGLFDYCTALTKVTFTLGTTTTIPYRALEGRSSVTEVNLPEGITSVGSNAFSGCSSLNTITIPDSVSTIGTWAFNGCASLTKINLPTSISSCSSDGNGYGPFYGSGISTFIIPEDLTTIPASTFAGCANLTEIEIPENIITIGASAFYKCTGLTEIIIPEAVSKIGNKVFQSCTGLRNVSIGDGVTEIGDYAFSACPQLTNLSIGESVKSIGNRAFEGCSSLENLYLPDSITTLGYYIFDGCNALTSINYPENISSCGCYFAYFQYAGPFAGSSITSVSIPNSVKTIPAYTFSRAESLNSITIPASVNRINEYAFYNCTSLSDVYYLASEEEWTHNVTVSSYNDPLLNATFHYVHAHTFGDWVVTKEATCTTDGSHYKTCSECGYVETEAIPALGHDFSTEWTIDTAMTCTVNEVKSHHCSRCDAKADVTVTPAPGHNYSAWTITREPTCIVAGSQYRTCSVCSNKETQSIPAPGHTYGDWTVTKEATVLEKGSKQRTCSVCGHVDKVVIDRIAIDINENTNYGLANFTVVNAQTLAPISGATLTISTDTDGTGTFTTDAEGKVSAVLPVGIQTVSARATGTLVRNLQVEILSGTNEIPKIGLSDMNTYDAKLTSKEMTYDEIVAAGIDPDAPENNHVFKYELQINFTAELDLYSLFYYMNSEDEVVGGESSEESSSHAVHWYACGEGTPGGYFYIEEEDITVVPVTENFYIIIRGQVKWLKEMYDVEMLVINNSATDTLEDVVAELNLPEGLSLAAMVEGEQTLRQEIGTVEESSSKSVHWYVRGDAAGSYQLSAALTGKVMPFNEEINQTYTTENALQVWAGNALHLDFEFSDAAYYADDYPITITLTNVSDKTLYKLSHTLSVIEGMEYYYDDGTTKKKITKKDIMGVGVLDEFNPGDKIVIETNVNIFFESELLEAQKEQLIGMVSGFEQLMKCYKAITSAYSAAETLIGSVSGAYSALTSYSASATSVFAGTAGKEKAEIAKKIYNAMAKLRKYTTTNNKIIDSVWNLFDATMSLNVVNDLKAIQQDPKTFFENNPINELRSYYNKIKAVGDACEASVESASGVENYKFNLFDSIKTLISAIPIRFVVSSIVMTERAGSTTSIPYSVSTYSTGPHYFGVSDMSKYVMSITKLALAETINGAIPWYAKMFVNVDDILDTDEATKYIQATENEIKAFQAKESTGTTTWRAYVVRNQNAQNQARFAKAKSGISNGFEISCSNNNAVFEDGVLTFTGGAYIYVKPTSTAGGTLYIENSEGAAYIYDISVVEAHSCVEGEKEIALAATRNRDGIAVTRCSVCNEIIDVTPITYSDCADHNFSEWAVLYEGDCQTCGIKQRSCETCGYTEAEMTEYGDHIPEYRNAVAATCTEAGYEGDIYCSVCEEYIDEGNAVPATGHNFGEWTVILPADCQNAGVEERVCANDSSHVETREIPKTDHVDKNGDGLCDNCGTEMAYTHGGTDEDNNRCKYCGQVHEGFLGKFVGFFHKIAYFFAHLFGKM